MMLWNMLSDDSTQKKSAWVTIISSSLQRKWTQLALLWVYISLRILMSFSQKEGKNEYQPRTWYRGPYNGWEWSLWRMGRLMPWTSLKYALEGFAIRIWSNVCVEPPKSQPSRTNLAGDSDWSSQDLGVFVDTGLPDKGGVVSLDILPRNQDLWPKRR